MVRVGFHNTCQLAADVGITIGRNCELFVRVCVLAMRNVRASTVMRSLLNEVLGGTLNGERSSLSLLRSIRGRVLASVNRRLTPHLSQWACIVIDRIGRRSPHSLPPAIP